MWIQLVVERAIVLSLELKTAIRSRCRSFKQSIIGRVMLLRSMMAKQFVLVTTTAFLRCDWFAIGRGHFRLSTTIGTPVIAKRCFFGMRFLFLLLHVPLFVLLLHGLLQFTVVVFLSLLELTWWESLVSHILVFRFSMLLLMFWRATSILGRSVIFIWLLLLIWVFLVLFANLFKFIAIFRMPILLPYRLARPFLFMRLPLLMWWPLDVWPSTVEFHRILVLFIALVWLFLIVTRISSRWSATYDLFFAFVAKLRCWRASFSSAIFVFTSLVWFLASVIRVFVRIILSHWVPIVMPSRLFH